MPNTTLNQSGFTLIELIISMALSTIIISQVLSQLTSQAHFQFQLSQSFRADQEIRNALEFIRMEFSRAGFINQPAGLYHENFYKIDNECILYRYDKNKDRQLDPQDAFGFRYRKGQIQISRNTDSCSGGYWESLTSPQTVEILSLRINPIDHLQECTDISHHPATDCNIHSCEYVPYDEKDILVIKEVIRLSIDYKIRATHENKTQELILYAINPKYITNTTSSIPQGKCNHA